MIDEIAPRNCQLSHVYVVVVVVVGTFKNVYMIAKSRYIDD